MDVRYKTYPAEVAVEDATRRMTFTISTGEVDRDNDTIDPKGWELDHYRRNPIVLFAHDYHALPVAKTLDIQTTDTALVATAEFPPKGTYAFADTVYDMLKGGFLNATSVGFRALEHAPNEGRKGYDYKRQELMEYSIVPIPSNPEALVSQRGVARPQLRSWTKAILTWATEHGAPALLALKAWNGKAAYTDEQYAKFEADYDVESEQGAKTLPPERVAKLAALHGIKEPESADSKQAEAMRKIHRAAMDAYANAHHADTVIQSMATMEANIPTDGKTVAEVVKAMSGRHKEQMDEAHGAVKRAKDHALCAAGECATMGGKGWLKAFMDEVSKPLPTPNDGESEQDFISRCAGNDTMNQEYPDSAQRVAVCYSQWRRHEERTREAAALWLELKDDDPDLLTIDEQELTTLLGRLVAEEAGAQTRAALNATLGRLD